MSDAGIEALGSISSLLSIDLSGTNISDTVNMVKEWRMYLLFTLAFWKKCSYHVGNLRNANGTTLAQVQAGYGEREFLCWAIFTSERKTETIKEKQKPSKPESMAAVKLIWKKMLNTWFLCSRIRPKWDWGGGEKRYFKNYKCVKIVCFMNYILWWRILNVGSSRGTAIHCALGTYCEWKNCLQGTFNVSRVWKAKQWVWEPG